MSNTLIFHYKEIKLQTPQIQLMIAAIQLILLIYQQHQIQAI